VVGVRDLVRSALLAAARRVEVAGRLNLKVVAGEVEEEGRADVVGRVR
jgi:hypothetical protein